MLSHYLWWSVDFSNVLLPVTEDWSYATKELLDTLPQAWTRGLLYFLVIFIAIVLPWAVFSKIDETGNARGRIEPKEETIKLDAAVGHWYRLSKSAKTDSVGLRGNEKIIKD